MKRIFSEYGLFILAVIIGMMCIGFFLKVFVGENSMINPILDSFLERLI